MLNYIPTTYPQPLDRNPADFTGPTRGWYWQAIDAFALPTAYVKALDVARYQEEREVDYAKAYAAGYRLVIARATQGTSYLDPMFKWHWQHALDAGFYIMFYHYFLDHMDGAAQADYFLTQTYSARQAALNRVAAWDDIERNPYNVAVPVSTRRTRAQTWYLNVKADIPRVGAYSSPALWQELMGNDTLSKYGDGWLAHWTSAKSPTIPPGWTEDATRIWQTGVYPTYPWVEPVPGVTGTVDVDRWLGDEKSLRDYLGYVDAPPSPDPLEARVAALEVEYEDLAKDMGVFAADLVGITARVAALEVDIAPTNTRFTVGPTQALARCIAGYNAAGIPIFTIYPTDSSNDQAKRIKWAPGTVLDVGRGIIVGDGGFRGYKQTANGLHVRVEDGELTG